MILLDERPRLRPYVRVFGPDAAGKTELCHAVVAAAPGFVEFADTDRYVRSWLRASEIGRSWTVTDDQILHRRNIFRAANRVQGLAFSKILPEQPIIAIRGRADTEISHSVLLGERVPHSPKRLFPGRYDLPDVFVLLTAPAATIGARLDVRGEPKTGANDLEYLDKCQQEYLNLAGTVQQLQVPVLVFDTSDSQHSPAYIADQVLGKVSL